MNDDFIFNVGVGYFKISEFLEITDLFELIITEMQSTGSEVSGFIGILIVQVTILILFGIFVRYDLEMLPTDAKNDNFTSEELAAIEQQHRVSYPRKWRFFFFSRVK